jgi:hypothetical protein
VVAGGGNGVLGGYDRVVGGLGGVDGEGKGGGGGVQERGESCISLPESSSLSSSTSRRRLAAFQVRLAGGGEGVKAFSCEGVEVRLTVALVAALEMALAAAPWAWTASMVQVMAALKTAPVVVPWAWTALMAQVMAPKQQIGAHWSLQCLPLVAHPHLRQRRRRRRLAVELLEGVMEQISENS